VSSVPVLELVPVRVMVRVRRVVALGVVRRCEGKGLGVRVVVDPWRGRIFSLIWRGTIWRDTGRYREIPGDTGRYEIRADTGGYGRIRADTGRCDEMQGDTGRYGQILQRYIKIPQKTVHRVVVWRFLFSFKGE
jgi:hypothetical protein